LLKTLSFRIKDSSSAKYLNAFARSVNFVWNFCNETQKKAVHDRRKWLSHYDLMNLVVGTSKDINLNNETIQFVCEQYFNSRRQHKKSSLRWRSKKSLGWIPFKGTAGHVKNSTIKYCGRTFKFWKSQEIPSKPKCGSFSQDVRGRWYVSLVCEYQETIISKEGSVGIDLGLKTTATLSTGKKYDAQKFFNKYQLKLAHHQRCKNIRQKRNIYAKIKNSRKDFNHKVSHELTRDFNKIYIGDVNSVELTSKKLNKTKSLRKAVSDACWGQLRSFVEYKAIARQGTSKVIREDYTTQTCSTCGSVEGPKGKDGLTVRVWTCSCGTTHDRDVNAAVNILQRGLLEAEPAPLGASSAAATLVAGGLYSKGCQNQPFECSSLVAARAEFVDKLSAVCSVCGGLASRTFRKVKSTERVVVGDKDMYEARCRKCYSDGLFLKD